MPTSAYIHIPFCKSKCKYCSFVSYCVDLNENEKKYVKELINEINLSYKNEQLKTVYFGGGTPSLLKIDSVSSILNQLNYNNKTEVTFEINPEDATIEYLIDLKKLGINRISFGSQTFDNRLLSLIGRRHDSEQTINAVKNAKFAGFNNISVDLIYGLPTQTISVLKNDLEIITSLNLQHISTYGLKIDKPSYFSKYPPNDLPNDDEQADMYLLISKYFEDKNYNRYEISNFSLSGYESKHNLNYWNNEEYYGFGAGAHGYVEGVRYFNKTNLGNYINSENKIESLHKVTTNESLEETIFLGLRKSAGINVNSINNQYNIDFNKKYNNILNKYVPKYIKKTDEGYCLTTKGFLLSNIILADFIE